MNIDFPAQIKDKTNEELIDIYLNSDNYQEGFVELALKELNKRGVDLTEYQLKKKHREDYMLERLEEGKPGNVVFIVLGFVSALLGGLIGIILGSYYSQSKHKHLADGNYYVYDRKTRNLGIGMMTLGIVDFILIIVFTATD